MKRSAWTPELIDRVQHMAATGATQKETALALGVTFDDIRNVRRFLTISFHGKRGCLAGPPPPIAQAVQRLRMSGLSESQIARQLGCTKGVISGIRWRYLRSPPTPAPLRCSPEPQGNCGPPFPPRRGEGP